MDFRIIKLDPMRVGSVYAFGESPETEAWDKFVAWAKPKGLLNDLDSNPIFGYNSPCPTKAGERYGYVFFTKVGLDLEPEEGVRISDFMGGYYAVTLCEVKGEPWDTIPNAWVKLVEWCKENNYEFGYHQELERHLSNSHNIDDLILELYCPIKK